MVGIMAQPQALARQCTRRSPFSHTGAVPRLRHVLMHSASQPPASMDEVMQGIPQQTVPGVQMLKRAMTDPAMAKQLKAMQEAMQRPEAQKEMAQMQAVMGNPQLQARMQALRSDPEFKDFFAEIQAGGMQMKYYNDPAFLAKLNAKVGDVAASAAASAGVAPPQTAAPAAAAAQINNLIDAARAGDVEAVEDFLAIGKDASMRDKNGRTPLHFAVGSNQEEIAALLVAAGAPLEAMDELGNTPLHYAAGYGRVDTVEFLLEKGANRGPKNKNGNTPWDLATKSEQNPVCQDKELLDRLKP